MEELPAIQANMKAQGKQTIMWDVKNAYFTWPIVSAGSYSFKKTENGHDAADLGINNEQARKNLAFLLDMKKQGIVDLVWITQMRNHRSQKVMSR